MKQISLRTFRMAVDRLDEPVVVVKREDGGLRTLGHWVPLENVVGAVVLLKATHERYGNDLTADDRTAQDRFGRPSAAPKPGKR